MKRKVGELFNKPIVQGNENVLSSNEILVEQKGNTFSLKERVNGEIKEVSGGGSTNSVEYLDISNNTYLLDILGGGVISMKIKSEGGDIPIEGIIASGMITIAMVQELRGMGATVSLLAIEFDPNLPNIVKQNGEIIHQTAYEIIASKGENYIQIYNNTPRLTKEQFYSLD